MLQALCLTSSRAAWDASDAGAAPIDAAMQVAIPEFDGRIITVPFSFKEVDEQGRVTAMVDMTRSHLRVNGGFFIFKREIFDHMREGEELVHEPFQRSTSGAPCPPAATSAGRKSLTTGTRNRCAITAASPICHVTRSALPRYLSSVPW